MTKKAILLISILMLIMFSFCNKEVKTIPDYLRKGTAAYHQNKGYMYLNQGSLNIAMEQFIKALKKKPGLIGATMGLGIVYLKQMKFQKSLKEFSKIAKHNPSNADAFNFIGIIYTELGDYDLAKENYLIAANSENYSTPENAYLNLAMLEMKRNKPNNALRYIEKGLIKNTEFSPLYNLRGSIFEKKGFYKKAVYNYERSLQLSGVKDINTKINIARGYIKMGKKNKALNLLEQMLGETPSPAIRKLIINMIKQVEKQ